MRWARLKRNDAFSEVIQRGKSFVSPLVVLYVKKVDASEPCRVGFSVGKKVGPAVRRNYYKRVLREIFRKIEPHLRCGYELVFIARPAIQTASFSEIEGQVLTLLKKARLIVKEDER